MSKIIAARFDSLPDGQAAAQQLIQAGFPSEKICTFYCNPAGQHGKFAIGGDRDESPGAENSAAGVQQGALSGIGVGLAVGLATTPVLGPLGPALGAAIGAQAGAITGTPSSLSDLEKQQSNPKETKVVRSSGVITAAVVDEDQSQAKAFQVLQHVGGKDIEQAHGIIEDGDWKDFDPLAEVNLIKA
jgi:hypothetical protein